MMTFQVSFIKQAISSFAFITAAVVISFSLFPFPLLTLYQSHPQNHLHIAILTSTSLKIHLAFDDLATPALC